MVHTVNQADTSLTSRRCVHFVRILSRPIVTIFYIRFSERGNAHSNILFWARIALKLLLLGTKNDSFPLFGARSIFRNIHIWLPQNVPEMDLLGGNLHTKLENGG